MELPQLTGAQKTRLRGLGQTLEPSLKIGQAGVTHAVTRELQRLLEAHELVKVRFIGADRDVRATLAATLATDRTKSSGNATPRCLAEKTPRTYPTDPPAIA